MGRKKKIRKEDIAEDCCFVCKDGGSLRICDYKDCLKSYHPQCVNKDDSLLETKERWFCGWHFCFMCHKTPKFHCFCCPSAVCGRCLCDAEFVLVKGKRGFCNYCLELAMLIEEKKDVGFNGGKIDFNDRDTYEYMFKFYWEIVKEKEGLTSEHVHSANNLLKNGKNHRCASDSNENDEGEEDDSDFEDESQLIVSDYEDFHETEEYKPEHKRKRSKGNLSVERKVKSKQKEFIGWGSKCLKEFLASIGKDTTEKLSESDVSAIIIEYCQENNLFHPEKKKKVICDARLQSLLGRKSLNKNSIYNLLTTHFAENLEQSEEDFGFSSEDGDESVFVACRRQKNSNSESKSQRKEEVPYVQQNCFASIVDKNIKHVYLKRSLVQELLKQVEAFESKVIGSFVRVKSDPNDYLQKNSHQLVQVTGVLRNGETNSGILLQVSNLIKDVPIGNLSDDDFSEEECEELRQRVKNGFLKRPTVMELEQKARSLHEDITKHWIMRELVLLQNRIDRANEKGWRRELGEYMDSLLLLQTPSEQSRLLHEVPDIIADADELEPAYEDSPKKDKQEHNASPESALRGTSETPTNNIKGCGISHCLNAETGDAGDRDIANERPASGVSGSSSASKDYESDEALRKHSTENDGKESKQFQSEAAISKELPPQSHISSPQFKDDDILQTERCQFVQEVKQNNPEPSLLKLLPQQSLTIAPEGQCDFLLQKKQNHHGYNNADTKQNQPVDVGHEKVKNQSASKVELIELSDDEKPDTRVSVSEQAPENVDCSVWYCVTPDGVMIGPYSMSVLKKWSDSSSYDVKFKVLKIGQSPEEAIFLTDAVRQIFSGKQRKY